MAGPAREYRRLPGVGKSLAAYARLWQGRDHLLLVLSTGFTEDYKRFYYADIQAVLIRRTQAGRLWNLAWGILAAVCPLAALGEGESALVAAGGFSGFFFALLLFNLMRGPTCACHLRTAVQTEQLFSLNRLRVARKVVARLKPLIAEAQGTLTPEEIQMKTLGASQAEPPIIGVSAAAVFGATPPPRHYHGRAHGVLFWLLLAGVPGTVLQIFVQSKWIDALGAILALATIIAAIMSLLKQRGSDVPRALRRIPWIALVCFGLLFLVAMGYGVSLVVRNSTAAIDELSPLNDPVMLILAIVSMLVSLTLGMTGLSFLKKFRQASLLPPQMPAALVPAREAMTTMNPSPPLQGEEHRP